jgi:hypothetical protein
MFLPFCRKTQKLGFRRHRCLSSSYSTPRCTPIAHLKVGQGRVARRKKRCREFTIEFSIFTTVNTAFKQILRLFCIECNQQNKILPKKLTKRLSAIIGQPLDLTHRFDLYQLSLRNHAEIAQRSAMRTNGMGFGTPGFTFFRENPCTIRKGYAMMRASSDVMTNVDGS